jgi:hypothetical protein
MFHLFKKVYLDFDDKINMSYDRIICSERFGGNIDSLDLSKVFYGELMASSKTIDNLIGEEKKFATFLEMLELLNDRVDQYSSPVYVYCDKESYYKFAIKWMKIILPRCTAEAAWKFFKSHIFKEKNFVNSRMSASDRFANDVNAWYLIENQFTTFWNDEIVTQADRITYSQFIHKVKNNLKVEFLLASYLYNKSLGDVLAKAITPLVKKDLEKFLYEHKEIILVHFQRPVFQTLLEVQNGPYTFDNFYDMVDDPAPLVQLMFKSEIWGETQSSMFAPTSSGLINLSAFTDQDITDLKTYSLITGQIWSDELWYTNLRTNASYTQAYQRSEIDKFDFIKFFKNKDYLTVEELDLILDYEMFHQHHAAGSFYAIDLRTVNTYFVDFLLMNYDNPELIEPFIVEINES